MAYIGTSPSNGVRRRFVYEATASQTSFSGSDENGVTLTYVDSLYLDVYQNGIKLKAGDDYTATTGTTVVLVQGASANDVVEMVAFDVFSVGDTVSAKDGGSFAGNVTMAGSFGVSGKATAPSSPSAGDMWFNSATSFVSAIGPTSMAVYNGSSWDQMSNKFAATGGTETTYTSGGVDYKVHTFTSSGTFTVVGTTAVDVLVVAGGGGGGNCNASAQSGGGGGAGGFITSSGTSGANSSAISPINVSTSAYSVVVGAGGVGGINGEDTLGTNGGNSSFSSVIAIGGGRGGANSSDGSSGGSGGGGKESDGAGQAGTAGQGMAGGAGNETGNRGGGGGGAGQTGRAWNVSSGQGGNGLENSIRTGSAIAYAGGGSNGDGAGGSGGGGGAGAAGAANTGGGGSADEYNVSGEGAYNGGSGIVVIRYAV